MTGALSSAWAKRLAILPGYDPVATADACVFDADTATRYEQFIEGYCTHVKGHLRGQRIRLETWQKAVIWNLFGWQRPDGTRRYREALLFVPRKNAKTTLSAAMALAVMYLDSEGGMDCYSTAADWEQAHLCFDILSGMVKQDGALASKAQIFKDSVVVGGDRSYKVLTSKAGTKHGTNPHLVVNDELHAQKDGELTDAMETGMGARRQPLLIHATTSDYERPNSVCNQKYDYACKVRDGVIDDPTFLPIVYEATRDDDWTDERIWELANPNIDVSVSRDYLRRQCNKAKETPSYENTFKRLHLNIRTEQAERWLQLSVWDQCQVTRPSDAELATAPCWSGLDLANKRDISAWVRVYQLERGGEAVYWLEPMFWVPRDSAAMRDRADRVPYTAWARDGYLRLTDGETTDYGAIRRDVNEAAATTMLQELAFDPWNAQHLAQQLGGEDGVPCVEFQQSIRNFNEPTKEFERRLMNRTLLHDGHPVLRWMASNVVTWTDSNNNLRPDKKRSSEKIDGIVAAIMGLARAMNGERAKSGAYDEPQPEFFAV